LRPWAAAVLGVSSLLMMFSAYWPCAGQEAPIWSALRHAAEAFEGYVAEPFGTVAGCPAEFPQTLMAGVLFGKTTLVLVAALALAHIFRDTIDTFKVRWARQVVVFSGVSDETLGMLRAVASEVTDQQTLLVLDGGPELARAREAVRDIRREFARDRRRAKAIVLPLDVVDSDAVGTFARSRTRRGIQGLYLMSPDSASNLAALKSFLPDATRESTPATTEVPARVVIRVDNPWHAEDWRRQQMIGKPGWLFDALSVREMAARHVASKMKEREVDCVVISSAASFSLAVLAELSFEHRLDDFLSRRSAEAKAASARPETFMDYIGRTPKVLLVGDDAKHIAEHFRDQLARFGIDRSDEVVDTSEAESAEEAMTRLIGEGRKPALIIDTDIHDYDATFMAVRHPHWTIFDWDWSVRGVTDEPLLGHLWMVGPTLDPLPDFGLDVWDRLGAVQHWTYVLNYLNGHPMDGDPNGKRGQWASLSAFARESNIRSFASFTRTLGELPDGARRLGTDLGKAGTQIDAPVESAEDFLLLAEREHESWMKHHEQYGYKYGPERKGKRHPDMRPWSELSDDERAKDDKNVRATNDLLRALGFILVRAT